MSAKIIPFPFSSEMRVYQLTGTTDFNELMELRANLVDHMFNNIKQGDPVAHKVLKEVGGKTIMEQIEIFHKHFPYWREWKEIHVYT